MPPRKSSPKIQKSPTTPKLKKINLDTLEKKLIKKLKQKINKIADEDAYSPYYSYNEDSEKEILNDIINLTEFYKKLYVMFVLNSLNHLNTDVNDPNIKLLIYEYYGNKLSNLETSKEFHKEPLLCWAARRKYLNVVYYLVENGVDVNISDPKYKMTALMYFYNNLDMVKYLVEHDADINIQNYQGETILVKSLKSSEYFDVTEYLIQHGADVNVDALWGSPLITACRYNTLETVKMLVENGADVNYFDRNDLTALMWAEKERRQDIVNYLLQKGANVVPPPHWFLHDEQLPLT